MPVQNMWIEFEGQKIGYDAMYKLFREQIEEEETAAGKNVAFPKYFPQEYKDKLDAFHKETTNMLLEMMNEYLATEVLREVTVDTVDELMLVRNPINAKDSGEFGKFLEKNLFGLSGSDNKPTADIDTFRKQLLPREMQVESKAKIGATKIDVGTISVYGLDAAMTELEIQEARNIAIIYKMMLKMQNLIYMSIKEESLSRGRVGISFRAMVLYTSLYLTAVWSILKHGGSSKWVGAMSVIPKTEKPVHDPVSDTYTVNYQIDMALAKHSRDILNGINNLARLYKRHTNLIDEMSGDGITARKFFAILKKMEGFLKLD